MPFTFSGETSPVELGKRLDCHPPPLFIVVLLYFCFPCDTQQNCGHVCLVVDSQLSGHVWLAGNRIPLVGLELWDLGSHTGIN